MRSAAAEQMDPLQERYHEARCLFEAKRYAESLAVCQEALGSGQEGGYAVYLLLSKGMNEYYLGHFAAMESTVAAMEGIPLPDVVHCRWLMLKGRGLAHRRNADAFVVFREAEQEFSRLGVEQDEAWAQLSAARLALMMGAADQAKEFAGRVRFAPYLPKAQLLCAEADCAAGDVAAGRTRVARFDAGDFGVPDQVDLARASYLKAVCALHDHRLVDAGLHLGEARNCALQAEQQDFELLNCIEKLRTQLESKGG